MIRRMHGSDLLLKIKILSHLILCGSYIRTLLSLPYQRYDYDHVALSGCHGFLEN